jgi:formylglycine-generating enzyme required for sulfatase activity
MTENYPRVSVSWYEAVAFCAWLTEQLRQKDELRDGQVIRLPHEAEWEQAARWNAQLGQADDRHFPWGNSEKDVDQRCNMSYTGIDHPSTVGLFPSGHAECGATDMCGNVWEWCEDWHDDKDKRFRVLRGGSFGDIPPYMHCGFRGRDHPGCRSWRVGFRVVCVGASAR